MTIDERIKATEHLLACQKAFKEGKKILFQGFWLDEPSWRAAPSDYSIQPEPKLRPWKPEEAPVGAVVRPKGYGSKTLLRVNDEAELPIRVNDEAELPRLLALFEWCWPHEQFDSSKWKPCGVVE